MAGQTLNLVLIFLSFIFLAFGSLQDLKSRLVSDWVWLGMLGGGILIHLIQIITFVANKESFNSYIFTWIVNILFALTLAIILTITGFGGEADRIAYIAIAVCTPISTPLFIISDPQYELILGIVPRILNVFFNAYLVAIPLPFLILVYNLINQIYKPELYVIPTESKFYKIIIRFIGYPHPTHDLEQELSRNPWHYDFLESFDKEKGWKITFRLRLASPEDDITRKEELIKSIRQEDKPTIWIQPSFPFIFMLMIGYLLELFVGNILFIWMSLLF